MSERHPASLAFHRVLREMAETHDRKQADYGRVDDPFANVRASADFGIPGWVGCMVRANDKMARIKTAAMQVVAGGDTTLANESLEDSLLDLANYAVIGLVLLRQEPPDGGTTQFDSLNAELDHWTQQRADLIEAVNAERARAARADYLAAIAADTPHAAVDASDADDGAGAQDGEPDTGLDGPAVRDRAQERLAVADAADRPSYTYPFASWLATLNRTVS